MSYRTSRYTCTEVWRKYVINATVYELDCTNSSAAIFADTDVDFGATLARRPSMSEILVNKLTGTSTAGSILVTGEGNSTTTNLAAGVGEGICTLEFCWHTSI